METISIIAFVLLTVVLIFLVMQIIKYQLQKEQLKTAKQTVLETEQKFKELQKEAKDADTKMKTADQKILDFKKDIEMKKQEALLEAKEEILKERAAFDKEIRERRSEITQQERRLLQKEENLDKKYELLENKENELKKLEARFHAKEKEIEFIAEQQTKELEKISKLSINEAKEILLSKLEKTLKREYVQKVKDFEEKTKSQSDKLSRKILSQAIQRCAVDHVVESTVSVVTLPSDDMKGKIIGREGRNIRTFEKLTGVELIIDDTPEAVVISGFDPVRREIARIALEYLVADGRIHPTRIEEIIEKAKKEVAEKIKDSGERVVFELGIQGLHQELIKALGRLQYRTSYGQNILQHSKEVSILSGIMAAELGVNIKLAKRAGLLHDLGKALTHEEEGTHTALGVELARKYNESPKVLHAMAAHHHDIEFESVEAVLVQVADALSAARPGARMEPIESYIKRMEKLEEIGTSFEGVEKCYAMQAGRELRIMVKPDSVSDEFAPLIARNIAEKIESEMEYPGQIKITVLRETRATSYAK